MWILYVIGAVLDILLCYFIADTFRSIAHMKGHYENTYFWWTFLMAPVGMLMVIALPDRKNSANSEQSTVAVHVESKNFEDELPYL